jgi:FdhD protein
MSHASRRGVKRVSSVVVDASAPQSRVDDVVVEEPLEIRVLGDLVASTMRTPGDDRFLAVGFLFAEGVLTRKDDLGSVFHCGRTDDPAYGNALEVSEAPLARFDLECLSRARRRGFVSSACGVCGREAIDDLCARVSPPTVDAHLAVASIVRLPELLSRVQDNFARTGGLHAACALDLDCEIVESAEDVGRHNAVDKVVGKLLYAERLPRHTPRPLWLAVSGRASFEIVQKAAMAGFFCVASISAPSSLAIETAERCGLTLVSFVRGGRFSIYAHAERIVGA